MISFQRSAQVSITYLHGVVFSHIFAVETVRPRRRLRTDAAQVKDKFNLSNDHFYEVAKDGGRHRVRQTFGQLVVEHAYPAQKLQLPFVRPFVVLCVHLLTIKSLKRVCPSKRLARSIDQPFNSPLTSRFASAKSAQRKRRRISPAEN